MTVAVTAAAFVTWLGASLIVLADGRRGVSLGLALVGIGLGFLAWSSAGITAAIAIAAGGLIGAVVRDRSGPAGWQVMPAGSTPRLILCIAAALLALWVAASVTTGDGRSLRFAVLSLAVQMGARILTARDPAVIVTAAAALALAVGEAGVIAGSASGPAPQIAAGLVAAGAMFVRLPAPSAA
ncbi:MAG TPA: hypothetical protein VJT78_04000 [Candidatus Dormibacteraeota bacterium]|nr:hypothetical protein [Candidatus Dormibacteraeota bacterium]